MKLPNRIGSYRLIAPLSKHESLQKFLIGKYEKNGKFYAIKLWHQGMPNIYHKELHLEFQAATLLHTVLHSRSRGEIASIQIPRPIEVYREKTFTALISEYVLGKHLSRYHAHICARVMAEVIEEFERISHQPLFETSSVLRRHPWWLYTLSLPYVAIRACMNREIPTKHIAASFWTCLRHVRSLSTRPSMLAHRDLLPENILMNGKKITVLDCTHLVLTPQGYDLSYVCIHELLHGLSKKITRRLNAKADPFFTAYICLLNCDNRNAIHNTNYYASTLATIYE